MFAEPRRAQSKKWRSVLGSSSIDIVPVARGSDPFRDPNDDAIHNEVGKLLDVRDIGAVALLVGDADFIPLVQDIVGSGKKCFVSVLRDRPGMARGFKRAGAELLSICDPESVPRPTYLCVLHGDGTGGIERKTALHYKQATEEEAGTVDETASKLTSLGYRTAAGDPLIPSIAKFWFENDLGKLIVYPTIFAGRSVAKLFHERPLNKWVAGRGNLAFIFPRTPTSATQEVIQEYRSSGCAECVRGGGPFMLRDSPTLVENILCKIGYIDDGKKTVCGRSSGSLCRSYPERTRISESEFRKVGVRTVARKSGRRSA